MSLAPKHGACPSQPLISALSQQNVSGEPETERFKIPARPNWRMPEQVPSARATLGGSRLWRVSCRTESNESSLAVRPLSSAQVEKPCTHKWAQKLYGAAIAPGL